MRSCAVCICDIAASSHSVLQKGQFAKIVLWRAPSDKVFFFSGFSFAVAILLKDDYYISGAGLPGRFKAEKVEFHWGQSNASAGSEHSINGRRFPVEVSRDAQLYH